MGMGASMQNPFDMPGMPGQQMGGVPQNQTIQPPSFCKELNIALDVFSIFPWGFPALYAVWQLRVNELRIFQLAESTQKQQQIVLEMFERQNEGVVLFSRSQNLVTGEDQENVLFANEAFKKLANVKDDDSVMES